MANRSANLIFDAPFAIGAKEDEETNPGIFGKNLAIFLAGKLTALGLVCEEPFAEDFGYLVAIKNDRGRFYIACASRETDDVSEGARTPKIWNKWQIFVFAEIGFFRSFFNGADRGERLQTLFVAVKGVLLSSDLVQNLREEN
jgi:hypothetical protein